MKFSDGTPLTASDVAFTFNLLMKNTTLASQAPAPTPLPVSATAPNASTAVLTFSQAEYANLFLIGSTYILPAHIWQSVSNPATYADANPVGTGPYELGSFSSQKVTFKQNPNYWQKSKVTVPEVIFPSYVSNTTANPALDSGQIGYAGNDVTNVQSDYLSANPNNHTWTPAFRREPKKMSAPEFARVLQLRVEKINVARSHADVGGFKAGGASESDEKIVHFESVAVAVMQHVLDIGIFPEVSGFLLFCGLGNFHVEVTHLLNAGIDSAELDLGRVAGADDPGDFLLERAFLVDEMLELVVPLLFRARPEMILRFIGRRAFVEMVELDARLDCLHGRHIGFVFMSGIS